MAASKMTNSHEPGLATSPRPIRVLLADAAGAFGKGRLSLLIKRLDVNVAGMAGANPAAPEPIRAGFCVAECLTDPLPLIARLRPTPSSSPLRLLACRDWRARARPKPTLDDDSATGFAQPAALLPE
jgi:hypothetical protein